MQLGEREQEFCHEAAPDLLTFDRMEIFKNRAGGDLTGNY